MRGIGFGMRGLAENVARITGPFQQGFVLMVMGFGVRGSGFRVVLGFEDSITTICFKHAFAILLRF